MKIQKLAWYAGLVSLAILFLGAGCSVSKDKEKSEAAVAEFHKLFNEGRFDVIYRQSSSKFKEAVTEEQLNNLLDMVKTKLGDVNDTKLSGWNFYVGTAGSTTTLGYESKYTKGDAVEQFQFIAEGGEVKLLHFNVNSPLLFSK